MTHLGRCSKPAGVENERTRAASALAQPWVRTPRSLPSRGHRRNWTFVLRVHSPADTPRAHVVTPYVHQGVWTSSVNCCVTRIVTLSPTLYFDRSTSGRIATLTVPPSANR